MKVKYVCNHCGSDDIVYDAWAQWDVEKQEFVLSHTFDYIVCNHCGKECRPTEITIKNEKENQN